MNILFDTLNQLASTKPNHIALVGTDGQGQSVQFTYAELLKEIERQMDGFIRLNPTSGLFEVFLARGGYNLIDLPLADEDNIDDKLIEFGIDYNKTYFRKDMEMQEEEFDTQQADEYHPPPQEGNSESNDESQGPQNESTGEYTPYNNKEYQNPDDEEDEEGFGQFNNQMFFGGGGGGGFEYGGDDDDGGGGG